MTHTKEELIALAKEAGMVISYACTYRNHEFCPCSSSKDEFCVGNEPYDIRSASFESLGKFATLLTASNSGEVEPIAEVFLKSNFSDYQTHCSDEKTIITYESIEKVPVGTKLYTTPPSSEQLVREALEKAAKIARDKIANSELAMFIQDKIRALIPE